MRNDLHAALQYLLLQTASEVHGGPGVFNKAGEFPTAEPADLPLSASAREYYRNGRPFLQRYLPFWLADSCRRDPLSAVLVATGGLSLGHAVPIYRLYGELKVLEMEYDAGSGGPAHALDERLGQLARRADRLRVPLRFAPLLYNLKMHFGLVREDVQVGDTGRTSTPSADDRH